MQYQLKQLLDTVVSSGGSDLHLHVDSPPAIRVSGHIQFIEGPSLTTTDTEGILKELINEQQFETLESRGAIDFSFVHEGNAQFRTTAYKSRKHYDIVLRQIPTRVYSMEDLNLDVDVFIPLLKRTQGLILVAGPTGSGKTTTLISMLDWINHNLDRHILTIEQPIEFFHKADKGLVSQREVGIDANSFAEALVDALREDPDVIMVGEMRDLATMESAVAAAETGHLVFATLHTTGAANTVDRILGCFPPEARDQVRTLLAASLTAVISQQLCHTIEGGVVPAYEIMIVDTAISALIRQAKTHQLKTHIQTGKAQGMVTLDEYLSLLVKQGIIAEDEALRKAQDPKRVRAILNDEAYTPED